MTLQSLDSYQKIGGPGLDGSASADVDLRSILLELQGLKITIATAVATTECAAVTGMTATDTIKAVIHQVAAGTNLDTTSLYTAQAGGMLCSKESDSVADSLLVIWCDKSGA